MCIALPHRVLRVAGDVALIERDDGETVEVSLLLLGECVAPGDYLLIQAGGFAMERLDADTAQQRLRDAHALFAAGGDAAFERLGQG